MWRILTRPIGCALILAACALCAYGQGKNPEIPYELLIRRLSDEDFSVREDASRILREAHVRAMPSLSAARNHPDAEVRRRVDELWERLGNSFYLEERCPEVLNTIPCMEHAIGLSLREAHDEDMPYLTKCRRVRDLCFAGGTVTDKGVAQLANMPELRTLTICSPKINGTGFRELRYLDQLKDLTIKGPVTDDGLAAISALPNLYNLRLADTHITDEGLKFLARRKSLYTVRISGAKHITRAGIEQLAGLPELLDAGFSEGPGREHRRFGVRGGGDPFVQKSVRAYTEYGQMFAECGRRMVEAWSVLWSGY